MLPYTCVRPVTFLATQALGVGNMARRGVTFPTRVVDQIGEAIWQLVNERRRSNHRDIIVTLFVSGEKAKAIRVQAF